MLNRPPTHNVADLRTWLPSNDKLWEATSAESWAELRAEEDITKGPRICDIVNSVIEGYPLATQIKEHFRGSAFSQAILLQTFHLGLFHINQLRTLTAPSVFQLIVHDARRWFQGVMSSNQVVLVWSPGQNTLANAAVAIRYHFAMLSTLEPIQRLQHWFEGLGVRSSVQRDIQVEREQVILRSFDFMQLN